MPDVAPCVHLGVPHELLPEVLLAHLVGDRVVLLLREHQVAVLHVDELAATAEGELHHVRRATARQRLIAKRERLRRVHIRRRDEEPLALTHVRAVAPAQLILRTRPRHALPHQVGHECRLGRCDAGHTARRLRDRRHEPVTLVVTAQELALLAADAGEEEQVPLVWPEVDHSSSVARSRPRKRMSKNSPARSAPTSIRGSPRYGPCGTLTRAPTAANRRTNVSRDMLASF